MLKVYEINTNILKEEEIKECANSDKYSHITNETILKQQIAKDKLLKFIMQEEGIVSAIEKDKNGKPYFVNSNIMFNITHSDNFVLIAVSDEEVGIDIQKIERIDELKLDKLSRRIYNDNDYNYFNVDENVTFIQIWTIKEAFLKCIGIGLINNFHDIYIDYMKHEIFYGKYNFYKYITFLRNMNLISIVSNQITKSASKNMRINIIEYKEQ